MRVVFHNFAAQGPESVWAAEAALCANDQGKFWDYYDKLYDNWGGENQGAFSTDNLKRFAADLGLNTSTFNTCLDSDKYAKQVSDERNEAAGRGVTATPTFFVNGKKILGAVPFESFRTAIEAELAK